LPALLVAVAWRFAREPREAALPARTARSASWRGLLSRSFVWLTLSYTLQGYVGSVGYSERRAVVGWIPAAR
jgi:hypothetical protein